MSDPKIAEFYKRAARLETQRANGKGFEAAGALGRSYYHRPQRRRRSILPPVLFLVIMSFLMKSAIYYMTGPELYNSRVNDLQSAPGLVERAGGWVMQADPVTLFLSGEIAQGVRKITS